MTISVGAVIEQYCKGNQVNAPALCYMGFRDSPFHVWGGEYDITDPNGQVWTGLGKPGRLIAIDGLEQAATLEAGQFQITLSGADPAVIQILANEDRGDYIDALCIVSVMFCDRDWQPLCVPIAIQAGLIGSIPVSRTMNNNDWVRKITMPCDNIFFGRGGAPLSYYTDTDQQQRYPGDTGCQYIGGLQDTSIPEPWKGF